MNAYKPSIIVGISIMLGFTLHAIIMGLYFKENYSGSDKKGNVILDNGNAVITEQGVMYIKRGDYPTNEGPWKKVE